MCLLCLRACACARVRVCVCTCVRVCVCACACVSCESMDLCVRARVCVSTCVCSIMYVCAKERERDVDGGGDGVRGVCVCVFACGVCEGAPFPLRSCPYV